MNGGSADGEGESFGDPFLALVPPTSLYRTAYAFAVPDFAVPDDWTHSLNLVVPAEAVGQVTLDGAAVPAGSFAPIGEYEAAFARGITVVSGGEVRLAAGMSSKPTMATSSGTSRPAAASARIAPMAIRSLAAKTASNGWPDASSAAQAS